ncbi:tRNA-dihydrouridine synthase, partial [Bacillus cereus group sp. BC251]
GREAYQNPYILAQVDNLVFGQNNAVPSRHEVVRMMLPYIEQELAKGNYLSHMTRHILGLFQNMQGARAWRRHLSENACKPGAGIQVVLD